MKYNTTPIKNVDTEKFIGVYNGVEFSFEVGETRNLPTEVSQHIADQLTKIIIAKDDTGEFENTDPTTIKQSILSDEIMTREVAPPKTFAQEVADHEEEFEEWNKSQNKEAILQKEKALEIANKNHGKTIQPPQGGDGPNDKDTGPEAGTEVGRNMEGDNGQPANSEAETGGGDQSPPSDKGGQGEAN